MTSLKKYYNFHIWCSQNVLPGPCAVMCTFIARSRGYTDTIAAMHPSARALVLTRARRSGIRPWEWPVSRNFEHKRRAQWTKGISCGSVIRPMSPVRRLLLPVVWKNKSMEYVRSNTKVTLKQEHVSTGRLGKFHGDWLQSQCHQTESYCFL